MGLANAAVVVIGLTLWILPAAAQITPKDSSPLAACGDPQTTFKVSRGETADHLDTPETGKATVYIVEVLGLADKGRVGRPVILQGLDGKWIGATQGFTYVEASITPGEHHLCSRWQSRQSANSDQVSLYNFEAAAGKRYFFRAQVVLQGNSAPLIDLQLVSEDEGRFLMSEAARAISTPKR